VRPSKSPIPSIPEPTDERTTQIAVRTIRQIIETFVGRQGDRRNRVVTVRDLEDIGLIDDATSRRLAGGRD
jgi:hypothetical protein